MSSCSFKHDPGPCPVDDTPHTACVSADYDGGLRVSFTPQGTVHATTAVPALLREYAAQPTITPPPEPAPVTFSTKTYRRALHGRGRKP